MSLRQKTISGLSWTFADKFVNQIIQFIIGIILARLLTPKEYGLTGMVTVFLAVSNVFITSGFGEALVRKNDADKKDYSTIFLFNVLIGIICYSILFLLANKISLFFNEPELRIIIVVLSLTLIINSFGLIPRVYLWKRMDFKALTKISIFTTIVSGSIALFLAYNNYGVWSLVWRSIITSVIGTVLLLILSRVPLSLKFDRQSFNELFGFSSKLLLSELLNQIYNNIYFIIIGKFFSARDLGLYSRADGYKDLPSRTLDGVVQSVSYPVLAEIKDDKKALKPAYKRLIKSTMLISFVLMIGMAAVSDNLILGLIGEKWKEAIPYLRLLCFVGMLYPLHSLNLNMINIQGRSDLFLRLEIIKKILAIPVIIVGVWFGIKIMIMAMLVLGVVGYYLNSYFSGKLIGYPVSEQINDISPSFLLAILIGFIAYIIGLLINLSPLFTLVIQILIGAIVFFGICELSAMKSYIYLKEIIVEKLSIRKTPDGRETE